MTGGSLFSGVGGFELGLLQSGLITEVKWQVEIDEYCRRVLERHFPDTRRYGDIRECGKHNLESTDVIFGGFPCQPFSVAGKRGGTEDDRYLWPQMFRLISEIKPTLVIAENVFGIANMVESTETVRVEVTASLRSPEEDRLEMLLTYEEYMLLVGILEDLESAGYWTLPPLAIPAVAVDAPHIRQRVWIVAYNQESRGRGLSVQSREPRQTSIDADGGSESESRHVADTERARLERSETTGNTCTGGQSVQSGQGRRETDRWLPEPDVGILAHGFSSGLARWPDEPEGIPRVATGVPDRVNKLKALGNAVVPPVACAIGTIIKEWMDDQSITVD